MYLGGILRSFVKQILVLILLAICFAGSTTWALSSSSEGILDDRHDRALDKVRSSYFYTNSKLDIQKLQGLQRFLVQQRDSLQESARMSVKTNLINAHRYEDKKAQERAAKALNEKAEPLAPYLFALQYVEELLSNHQLYTPERIHELVERILLFYSAGYTVYPESIVGDAVERIKVLAENFFEFSEEQDQSMVQASNLLLGGKFQSQQQLQTLRAQGVDLSKLDPPTSAFWNNNSVEQYDPENEIFFAQKLFPPRTQEVPEFYFERMGNGQVKFKTYWQDSEELNKKGKPKKKDVTLRVGWESYTASVVNQFARIIGYPANPTTFRKKVKLHLGDMNFEEFMSYFKSAHSWEMGGPMTHVRRIPGENAVYILNATLEAYPEEEDYRRISPYRMGDNGFRNRREYRAMVMYNALISLQDQFEYQSRVDAYRDPVTNEWKPLFFIADTSSALGLPAMLGNKGTVNEFTWHFTKRSDEQVRIFWLSVFNSRTWKDTTYSDVKWMARRMARISPQQIDKILALSGFPEPVQKLYANKFKTRINQMIRDFKLDQEGFKELPFESAESLNKQYPQHINEHGFLKEGSQEIEGVTQPILGNRFTPYQGAVVMGLNAFQNKLLSMTMELLTEPLNPITFDLGNVRGWGDVLLTAKRHVSVNSEQSPNQKRYLLRDEFTVSIPVGFVHDKFTTPVAIYYSYTYEYTHSVSTMLETMKSRFFGLMNPFALSDIRKHLQMGEQLSLSKNFGASFGYTKVKSHEDLKLEAALLGLTFANSDNLYFSKPSPDFLEIAATDSHSFAFTNGVDVRAIVKLGLLDQRVKSESQYKLYRIDLLNMSEQEKLAAHDAFDQVLLNGDLKPLDALYQPLTLDSASLAKRFSWSFLIWTGGRQNELAEFNLAGEPVLKYSFGQSYDRSFSRIFTSSDKIQASSSVKSIGNFVSGYFKEKGGVVVSLEAKPTADWREFEHLSADILIEYYDGHCSRQEFEKDLKPFFSSRAGESKYIDFVMPSGLKNYLELYGQMRWQLSAKAIMDIVKAATHEKTWLVANRVPYKDTLVEQRATKWMKLAKSILQPPQNGVSPQKLETEFKSKARNTLELLKALIGSRAKHISRLRGMVQNQDIWIYTYLKNVLDLSHSSFRQSKGNFYFAPEIGKYQGPTPMEEFNRKYLLAPIFQ